MRKDGVMLDEIYVKLCDKNWYLFLIYKLFKEKANVEEKIKFISNSSTRMTSDFVYFLDLTLIWGNVCYIDIKAIFLIIIVIKRNLR